MDNDKLMDRLPRPVMHRKEVELPNGSKYTCLSQGWRDEQRILASSMHLKV